MDKVEYPYIFHFLMKRILIGVVNEINFPSPTKLKAIQFNVE